MNNKYIRTDLAMESRVMTSDGDIRGTKLEASEDEGVPVTKLDILDDEGSRSLEKAVGSYFTFTTGRVWYAGESENDRFARVIGRALKALLPEEGVVFIAGLGNRSVTCDAFGPLCCDKINVTRHIRALNPALYESIAGSECAALAPGVVGQTGIETAEIIRGITERVKPSAVIVCDALCARASERLCATVQLSDTGIAPGSGVGNHRLPLDRNTLGIPVISLGVPTVVDSSTLVYDALEKAGITEPDDSLIKVLENGRGFFVSLRDCDIAVEALSALCAHAVNYALGNDYS